MKKPPTPPASPRPPPASDCRCACGSLLARLVDDAVELKCRRCKRVLRLPVAGASRAWRSACRAEGLA